MRELVIKDAIRVFASHGDFAYRGVGFQIENKHHGIPAATDETFVQIRGKRYAMHTIEARDRRDGFLAFHIHYLYFHVVGETYNKPEASSILQ